MTKTFRMTQIETVKKYHSVHNSFSNKYARFSEKTEDYFKTHQIMAWFMCLIVFPALIVGGVSLITSIFGYLMLTLL